MNNANMNEPSQSVDALRQQKNMTEITCKTLDANLDFLSLKEVAAILRVAPISVYRLIAKRFIPVFRPCRKILFKKEDVLRYLDEHRSDPLDYGRTKD